MKYGEAIEYAIDRMMAAPESDQKKTDAEAVVALLALRYDAGWDQAVADVLDGTPGAFSWGAQREITEAENRG